MIKNNMCRISFYILIMLIGAVHITANVFANVKLPAIFSDKMVLQQQSKVAVWGWADPGERIIIIGNWSAKSVSVTADASGNWKGWLQTPKAGGPYKVKITGNNSVELNDVLLGEVWVCSGQSNMVFSLKSSYNANEEIQKADYPNIRYFSVKRQYGMQEFKDAPGSAWEKTSSETAPSFSAVAYYFAKKIHKYLNVPVGIVYAAWGGTPAEAWTPKDVLLSDNSLSVYIDRWKKIHENVGKDSVEYHIALRRWEKNKIHPDSTKIKKPSEPQTLIYYKRPWREPGVLFNGMINPVIPYGIKGFLWYQGESNIGYANEYYHLSGAMINSWRSKWNSLNLPFYFVQLPAFGYNNLDAAARLRESQYQVTEKVPNTGMAVTLDVGNMKDIHPTRKKEVGERLALIALAKNYGAKKIIYKGPEYKKVYTEKGKVIIEFDTYDSALKMHGDTLKGFEIGYTLPNSDSMIYVHADAKIESNKVIVWNYKVKQPLEVRYAWLLIGEANLFNKEGLPAFPFRKKVDQK